MDDWRKKKICKIPAQICHKGESIEAHRELDASKLRRASYNGKLFLKQNHSKEKSNKEKKLPCRNSSNVSFRKYRIPCVSCHSGSRTLGRAQGPSSITGDPVTKIYKLST